MILSSDFCYSTGNWSEKGAAPSIAETVFLPFLRVLVCIPSFDMEVGFLKVLLLLISVFSPEINHSQWFMLSYIVLWYIQIPSPCRGIFTLLFTKGKSHSKERNRSQVSEADLLISISFALWELHKPGQFTVAHR